MILANEGTTRTFAEDYKTGPGGWILKIREQLKELRARKKKFNFNRTLIQTFFLIIKSFGGLTLIWIPTAANYKVKTPGVCDKAKGKVFGIYPNSIGDSLTKDNLNFFKALCWASCGRLQSKRMPYCLNTTLIIN